MEVFMKVLKRNQIIIFLLALMLVTAGYLSTTSNHNLLQTSVSTNYNNTNVANSVDDSSTIGDATFVNGGVLVENEDLNMISNNTVSTNTKSTEVDDYFSNSKLQRDSMYSQSLDSYQKMLDSTTISSEQKAIAQNEITRINNEKNAIMISENLIKTKGFEDIIIFINGDSINAVIKSDKLSQEEIAQIQNILSRELKSDISNIHISNK